MDLSQILQVLHHPIVLQTLQLGLTLYISALAGVALTLHQWSIPMLRLHLQPPSSSSSSSPSSPSRSPSHETLLDKIAQFNYIIKMGWDYLLPSSRLLGLASVLTSGLLWSHPEPRTAGLWKVYALALAVVLPVAPFEQYFIFPINNRVREMGEEIERIGGVEGEEMASAPEKGGRRQGGVVKGGALAGVKGSESADEDLKKHAEKLDRLLRSWQMWHTGRVLAPAVAAVVTGYGLLRS